MRFLLDTNIVSDIVRHPRGKIANRISEVGEGDVCTSIIVAAELRYGATKKNSPRLTAQLEAVLGALVVLALEAPAELRYGKIRASLKRKGRPIGANDRARVARLPPAARIEIGSVEHDAARIDARHARLGLGAIRLLAEELLRHGRSGMQARTLLLLTYPKAWEGEKKP